MLNQYNSYNKTDHDSKELVYMYAKICNMEENTIIGRYKILKYLGRGGFGIVYKCFDSALNTEVAIKFLDPMITRDEKKFHRIKREINISRKITDNRIVKIFTMEKYYDVIFLVMEYIEGIPLSEIIETKRYDWHEFKPILLEILIGLKLLHQNKIIHRDLKPGNIMVLKDGSIKIVDFGLAKEITDKERTSATEEFSGTAEYVSPEQVEGEQLDIRSDIYQVGLIVFKVLTGQHPLTASSTMELLVKYLTVKPRKISEFRKDLPEYARFVTGKMLERKKSNRFNNVEEIITLLKKSNVNLFEKLRSATQKNLFKILLIGLVSIMFLLYIYFNTYGISQIDKVYKEESIIYAKNRFNRILWSKDFFPDTVIDTFTIPEIKKNPQDKTQKKKQIVIGLIKNSRNNTFLTNASINSTEADNKVAILSHSGKEINKVSFYNFFNLQNYNYEKMFKISGKIHSVDFNGDQNKEVLFKVSNALDMFPHGLIYFRSSQPLVYTSPGDFSYQVVKADHQSLTFTVFSNTVPVYGINSFSEVTLKDEAVYGVPNLSSLHYNNFDGYTYFLPVNIKIENNAWKSRGEVRFINYNTGSQILINRNREIIIQDQDKKTVILDPDIKLKRFNILINTFYKEKTMFRDFKKARILIDQAIALDFKNPFLNSALYYLKGKTELQSGQYKAASDAFNSGLNFYDQNPRIAESLCTVPYLMGHPLKALESQEKNFSSHEHFWGLPNGTELFKIYMNLAAGFQTKAEEMISKLTRKSEILRYSLLSILSFYKGDLKNAEKIAEIGLKSRRSELSNVEYRLICARLYILNDSNLSRARFFLKDIMKYSRDYSHLSELSLAYLLAKDKKTMEAENMANYGYEKVKRIMKGDFMTRFWFFYESFIYGQTMALLGKNKQAYDGYNACIEAAPSAHLSRLATERIRSLNQNLKD